jgi:hypothetical protein
MNEFDVPISAEERAIADALVARRPMPAPSFRSELSNELAASDPGYGHRPARLWLHAGSVTTAGVLLLLVGLLVSTGTI